MTYFCTLVGATGRTVLAVSPTDDEVVLPGVKAIPADWLPVSLMSEGVGWSAIMYWCDRLLRAHYEVELLTEAQLDEWEACYGVRNCR